MVVHVERVAFTRKVLIIFILITICKWLQASSVGDKELIEFLAEEIEAEKQNRKLRVASSLDGFDVKFDRAEMTLSKKFNNEMYLFFY